MLPLEWEVACYSVYATTQHSLWLSCPSKSAEAYYCGSGRLAQVNSPSSMDLGISAERVGGESHSIPYTKFAPATAHHSKDFYLTSHNEDWEHIEFHILKVDFRPQKWLTLEYSQWEKEAKAKIDGIDTANQSSWTEGTVSLAMSLVTLPSRTKKQLQEAAINWRTNIQYIRSENKKGNIVYIFPLSLWA